MIQFSDSQHDVSELIFQGAKELDIEDRCSPALLETIERWQNRPDASDADAGEFKSDDTLLFTISYDGHAGDYWPDEPSNLVGESLIREFLYKDGICNLENHSVRLYEVHYKLIAMVETEYLLVCPYPTASGNIGGILVVCVNRLVN